MGVTGSPPARQRRLTQAQARRVAIASQGLHRRPSGMTAPSPSQVARCVQTMGTLQIDSVNVLARSHFLPLFARLGPYDQAHVTRISGRRPRRIVEYWAHMASFVPVETWPLLRWRMAGHQQEAWSGIAQAGRENPGLVEDVLGAVVEHGPLTSAQLMEILGHAPRSTRDHWGWNWSLTKTVAEYLFFAGRITCAGRTPSFERIFDLPERVLPPDVVTQHPSGEHATTRLVEIAARAHGVASLACLADYFRLKRAPTRAALQRLMDDGRVQPVEIDGWGGGYLHTDAKVPRRVDARALLSPFDPLVWERVRTQALFGFRYRIEIYTPAAKRVHGYYVLPFLLRDALVARVDLKADRAAGCLRVQSAWREPDAPDDTARELAGELQTMAAWLGLDHVAVMPLGDLSPALARHL